jgi:glycosyltransferase involved in cell wall biosynthesis
MLINYEYPPLGGGAGNATERLAHEFASLNCEVLVLTSSFKELAAYETAHGFAIRRVPALRRRAESSNPLEMLSFMASACVWALKEAKQFKPDRVIAFFGIPSGPVGLLLKLIYGVPYIVSLRGGDVPGFQPYDLALYHKAAAPVIRALWRQARKVVANSVGLLALAQRFEPQTAIEIIPNGVDAQFFKPDETGRGSDPATTRLLFVGRLVYQKGVDILLKALSLVSHDLCWSLDVIGDGPLRLELEQMVLRLGLTNRVFFRNWLPRSEILAYYQQSDALILPSRDEGMSNVALEAMASGLPVIASHISGNEECVKDGITGFLVPKESVQALHQAIVRIMSDHDLRKNMGRQGRKTVLEHYTWEKTAKAYLDLW